MASKTTAELTAADPLDGTELVHVVQGGNSRKTTTEDIFKGEYTLTGEEQTAVQERLGVPSLEIIRFVPVRHTVLTGPVGSTGYPDFLEAGTGLQVVSKGVADTAGNRLVMSWADGFDDMGAVNFVARRVSGFSFDSLANNTTSYLFAELDDSTGAVTFSHSTLVPVYSMAKPSSPSSGQYWYPMDHRSQGEVWNGSAWVPTHRLYLGQVLTSGGAVSSVICYAFQGRARVTATLVGPTLSLSHNIGAECVIASYLGEVLVSRGSWPTGTRIDVRAIVWDAATGVDRGISFECSRLIVAIHRRVSSSIWARGIIYGGGNNFADWEDSDLRALADIVRAF